jgi:hypothetical protein
VNICFKLKGNLLAALRRLLSDSKLLSHSLRYSPLISPFTSRLIHGNESAGEEAKSAALIGAGMEVATDGTAEPIIRLAVAAKRAVRQRIRER